MAEWYVCGDTGSDATGDGSSGNPFATIQKGLDAFIADENAGVVYVKRRAANAAYAEEVSGTVARYFALVGYGSSVGDGVQAIIDGEDTRDHGISITTSGNFRQPRVANFEVRNTVSHGLVLGGLANLSSLIANCYVHDCGGRGISTARPTYMGAICRCTVIANGDAGIFAGQTSITQCFIAENGASGIAGDDRNCAISGCVIVRNNRGITTGFYCTHDVSHCVIAHNTEDGIGTTAAGGHAIMPVSNCVIAFNGEYGMRTQLSGPAYALSNCALYSNTSGNFSEGASPDVMYSDGVVTDVDPDFVAPYEAGVRTDPLDYDYTVQAYALLQKLGRIGHLTAPDTWRTWDTLGAQSPEISTGGIIRRIPKIIGA